MTRKMMVVIDAEFVDGCASLTHPDGDFGGLGWTEYNHSKSLVLNVYTIDSPTAAIAQAADEYDLSVDILSAYELMPEVKPLTLAYMEYIESLLIIQVEKPGVTPVEINNAKYVKENLQQVAEYLADTDMHFDNHAVDGINQFIEDRQF